MKLIRIFLVFVITLFLPFTLVAQQENNDSIRASLLTCSPGKKIYEIYGHTGLRIQDFTHQRDVVFNYGVFSFDQPHFILNFTLGECDYQCAYFPYDIFMEEYEERGSSVTEQVLNLTNDEVKRLYMKLIINIQPENSTYRYNFLKCNCTTKVRDIIEESVDGKVEYVQDRQKHTFRQILHDYTKGYDWYEAGNDILLGSSVDTVVTDRASMFAPERMMAYADNARIVGGDGASRPLVCSKQILLKSNDTSLPEAQFALSPSLCFWLLFALVFAVSVVEIVRNKMMWGLDMLLMLFQGISGLFVSFLFFFSSHPGVGSNWQVIVLNPLPLLAMPWVVRCALKSRFCSYHIANVVVLTLFIVFYKLIPQDFCKIVLPLTFSLIVRSLSYLMYYKRNKIKR